MSKEAPNLSHLIRKELLPRGAENVPRYTFYFHISLGRVTGTSERFGKIENQSLIQRFGFNVRKEKYEEFKEIWESQLPINQKISRLIRENILWKPKTLSYTHIDYHQDKIREIYNDLKKERDQKIFSEDIEDLKKLRKKVEILIKNIDELINKKI